MNESSLEKIHTSLTIPGLPEIEMKQRGVEILLPVEKVQEYLKLFVWCTKDVQSYSHVRWRNYGPIVWHGRKLDSRASTSQHLCRYSECNCCTIFLRDSAAINGQGTKNGLFFFYNLSLACRVLWSEYLKKLMSRTKVLMVSCLTLFPRQRPAKICHAFQITVVKKL